MAMASPHVSNTPMNRCPSGLHASFLSVPQLTPTTVSCQSEGLISYIREVLQYVMAPQIFNVKMFEPKNELRCARLTVAKSDAVLLRSSNFWPRPIYARSWNFNRNVSSSNEFKATATVDCLSATAENQVAHSTNSVPNGPELAAQ